MATYLDHNASTPLDARVLEAMHPYMTTIAGNASSLHRYGRLQHDAIETARQQIAQLVGTHADQVILTSGGTEANNLALKGVMSACRKQNAAGGLCIGATEHMSVLQPAQALQQTGCELTALSVDRDGKIDRNAFKHAITDCSLVSVMMANNETGVIENVAELAAIVNSETHNRRIWMHSDASQAAGKIAIDFDNSGLHAMTVSAHKLYGPLGVGALIIDKRLPIDTQLHGGVQEQALRAGTENVPAIVGFGMAAQLAMQELQQRYEHTAGLRDALQQALLHVEGVEVFAQDVERLPNTLQFGVHGFDGETLLMQLDRKGFAVTSGSACTSGKTEPSHVLKAMQVQDEIALSAVRVSFGMQNTLQDVDAFIGALKTITQMKASAVMMAAHV